MINMSILIQRLRWHQQESSNFAESLVKSIDSVSGAVREKMTGGWQGWMTLVKCVIAMRQIWKVGCKLYSGWGCTSSTCSSVVRAGGKGKMELEEELLRICARFGGFGVGVVLDLI
jgi:hypothetical protein